ncbi:MAG: hypothetical protein ACRDQZ_21875 [Mycobacteriales bacterium]
MSYLPVVVVVGCLCALYPCWLSYRLRRLHSRVASAAQALDNRLTSRARTVLEVVGRWPSRHAELATSLRLAATRALTAPEPEREAVHSELTKAIARAINNPIAAELLGTSGFAEVITQNRRTEMARALYNDTVRDTFALRRKRLLRALRLAAHLPAPAYFDIDTTLPTPSPHAGPAATEKSGVKATSVAGP